MTENNSLDAKVYSISDDKKLSIKDLLDYFAKRGSMRVSDLHLKVNCPPIYRVDGKLRNDFPIPPIAAPWDSSEPLRIRVLPTAAPLRKGRRCSDHIFQLSHIARPRIVHHYLQEVLAQSRGLFEF